MRGQERGLGYIVTCSRRAYTSPAFCELGGFFFGTSVPANITKDRVEINSSCARIHLAFFQCNKVFINVLNTFQYTNRGDCRELLLLIDKARSPASATELRDGIQAPRVRVATLAQRFLDAKYNY